MKILLVSSAGGHLFKTLLLKKWWSQYERVWVTREDPISKELLTGEHVLYGYFPENRHVVNFFKNLILAWRVLRQEKPDLIFSMGAGVAVPFFWIGWLLSIKAIFIETFISIPKATLTGKLVFFFCDIFFVQHPKLKKYYPYSTHYCGDVSELMTESFGRKVSTSKKKKVLVLTGTTHFPTKRLLDTVISHYISKPDFQVLIQSPTYRPSITIPSNISITAYIPHAKLITQYEQAETIISTAGEATCLELIYLSTGRVILFPRLPSFGEHIDDQQKKVASFFSKRKRVEIAFSSRQLKLLLSQEKTHLKRSSLTQENKQKKIKKLDEELLEITENL